MDTPLKIALVEDNDDLRDLLFRDIAKARYAVQSAGCADDLDDLAAMMSFDVLVLDVNLPGENGFEIAQRYKQSNSSIYVIMLTARGDPD
ncbi:MAG: response regulator transcription factor, partial [Fluviibacter sp.]